MYTASTRIGKNGYLQYQINESPRHEVTKYPLVTKHGLIRTLELPVTVFLFAPGPLAIEDFVEDDSEGVDVCSLDLRISLYVLYEWELWHIKEDIKNFGKTKEYKTSTCKTNIHPSLVVYRTEIPPAAAFFVAPRWCAGVAIVVG